MAIRQWVGVIASVVPLAACPDAKVEDSSFVLTAPAARYYVDPKGTDSNPGTSTAPFKTIQRAADRAKPGDTVVVRRGRYTGGERIVSVTRGGAAREWLTFIAEPIGGAVLDGRNGASHEAWYFGPQVSYVLVEGFEITGLQEHGFDTYGGGVHDLVIARNHVHHIGRNCTNTSNGRTGASLGEGTSRVTFDGNVWHDIGRFAPGENGCRPSNENYQNHDHGIYVADADEITITNNVFYNFARGWAVHRYFSRGTSSRGLTIVNNTFVGNNPYRSGQIILATPTAGLRIENNIFYRPQEAALNFENLEFTGASVRGNMIYGAVIKAGRPRGVSFVKNWEQTDPRLVGGTDFRLRSGSPAIDVGLPHPEIIHDADGKPRPRGRGYDLGAYEY
jgi:parallel beta helix pectate lyase-like protein/pectate lyase-like protein